MYYSHAFYRILVRAHRLHFYPDAFVILNRDGEEEKRIPYASLTREEALSVCHYIGQLSEKIRESL